MEDRIGGAFPGGPSRKGSTEERGSKPRLTRVEDIELRKAAQRERRARRRRLKRLAAGVGLSVVVAGAGGVYLGLQSHQSIDEIRSEQSFAEESESGFDMSEISQEVNRTLLELWRMEQVEYTRNSR